MSRENLIKSLNKLRRSLKLNEEGAQKLMDILIDEIPCERGLIADWAAAGRESAADFIDRVRSN